MELPGIEGRGALVSGAASGIGFAIARALAGQGARVLVCDLRAEAAHAAAAAIASETDGRVEALGADASREQDVAAAVAFAEQRFGALDILVSSAGVQHVAPIEEFPIEKFRQIIDLMLAARSSPCAAPCLACGGGASATSSRSRRSTGSWGFRARRPTTPRSTASWG